MQSLPSRGTERQSGGKKAALGASGSDQQARDSRAPGRQQGAFKAILREFLVCFSLKSNLRTIGKLARVDGRKSAPGASANRMFADVKVVHGIRTLSMVCIIFGHTIGLVGPEMMSKYREPLISTRSRHSCSHSASQPAKRAASTFPALFLSLSLALSPALPDQSRCRRWRWQ